MNSLVLKVFVHEGGRLPEKGKNGDAGLDVFARLDYAKRVEQTDLIKIPLGFSYAFWQQKDPMGFLASGGIVTPRYEQSYNYWLDVRNRSGVGTKSGMVTVAEVGDANYRGELHFCAVKVTPGYYDILPGDKIAQILIHPFINPHLITIEQVSSIEELGSSARGDQGFGASGK